MHVFWGMKKLVQLKFVQLLLLNRVKAKWSKKPCSSRFLLHKFVQLKYFWTLFKNVHLQGPCSLRPCISRPYCSMSFNFLPHFLVFEWPPCTESKASNNDDMSRRFFFLFIRLMTDPQGILTRLTWRKVNPSNGITIQLHILLTRFTT